VAQEPTNEFVSGSTVAREELAPAPMIYGAYAFVWAVFMIYLFFLWRRIGRVERELADVNQKLAAKR
jgi:hypothetical protein